MSLKLRTSLSGAKNLPDSARLTRRSIKGNHSSSARRPFNKFVWPEGPRQGKAADLAENQGKLDLECRQCT
ncbi:hypothetical protein RRG08_054873 [Elysia crispata]|uniref:Uncharacterized protein n=1 Tax=Elysia crispata TaxID=231223 RepID=A0AAE1A5B2_9GAST|nr:hypothetical protein RRG08_054873 [Elysia crispata]